eukprot:6192205-Pleurochrysis_carterae.AAC.2
MLEPQLHHSNALLNAVSRPRQMLVAIKSKHLPCTRRSSIHIRHCDSGLEKGKLSSSSGATRNFGRKNQAGDTRRRPTYIAQIRRVSPINDSFVSSSALEDEHRRTAQTI